MDHLRWSKVGKVDSFGLKWTVVTGTNLNIHPRPSTFGRLGRPFSPRNFSVLKPTIIAKTDACINDDVKTIYFLSIQMFNHVELHQTTFAPQQIVF